MGVTIGGDNELCVSSSAKVNCGRLIDESSLYIPLGSQKKMQYSDTAIQRLKRALRSDDLDQLCQQGASRLGEHVVAGNLVIIGLLVRFKRCT